MTILVASLGRCGSSMVYNSIKGAKKEKTHQYPHQVGGPKTKILFIYGNPVDTIYSLYAIYYGNRLVSDCKLKGAKFIEAHTKNMIAKKLDAKTIMNSLVEEDFLQLSNMFDAWMETKAFNSKLLLVHYDELWNRENEIQKFLGVPFKLPPRQTRPNAQGFDIPKETKEKILSVYGELAAKIEQAPKFQIR